MARPKKEKLKQADLPGMENRKIEELDTAAREYVEHRDERMAAMKEEVQLKTTLLSMMHKHRKTVYMCEDVTIQVVAESEKVKVRVEKPKEKKNKKDVTVEVE
jgi:hypothetical protein